MKTRLIGRKEDCAALCVVHDHVPNFSLPTAPENFYKNKHKHNHYNTSYYIQVSRFYIMHIAD